MGRGAKRTVLIPRDRPKPAAQSDHFTKRAHHKASASQNERVTKRACADARSLPCRGTTRCKRGELFVTADLLLPSDCHCVARPLKTGRYPSTGADRDRGGPTGADRTPLGTPRRTKSRRCAATCRAPRVAPAFFSRLWTTCNNRKATASTDDQRDDASAEHPASSMQVRKNLELTCHVTSGVLSDTTSVRNTQYHPCCTRAAGRRCPACTQCTLT